jgi:magnesium chelatase family protein
MLVSGSSRYYAKISGPLLDRIDGGRGPGLSPGVHFRREGSSLDIQVEALGVRFQDIISKAEGESSEEIRNRVGRARLKQLERFAGRRIYASARWRIRQEKTT